MKLSKSLLIVCLACFLPPAAAEDGYRAWLRYEPVADRALLKAYRARIGAVVSAGSSPTLQAAERELKQGLSALLDRDVPVVSKPGRGGAVLIGTPGSSRHIASLGLDGRLAGLGPEGYLIADTGKGLAVAANSDIGVLYGAFHFLRHLQTHRGLENLSIAEKPDVQYRLLNHWDNLDRSVERGYAGESLWRWHELPEYRHPRYTDYARINASIGVNGTVLTNVNANADVLTRKYLEKVKALSEVFRPYGIRVFLTARFSAPMEIGGLETADPLDKDVAAWWKRKADEIYELIPDFGGFLVKANSEGQPGPQDYGRSHAEGANLLARAVKPHGGIVMWRAFVYSNEEPEDRAKQAYNEFVPLDGRFEDNVLIQTKNGPIDFQPREPFHPLFGAMKQTPLMMEFQVTQEYLGQGLHLTYLAPLYTEVLESDTYARGEGSTVAKVIDGSLFDQSLTGVAGVSNIGADRNWTGHPFGQANWYAFGRLAWDLSLSPEALAREWIPMTFTHDEQAAGEIERIMMQSYETAVNYRTPLGLHHIMAWHHHYGPGPWVADKPRADWTSVYYHRADKKGVGFDRTASGSNAVSQYYPEVAETFADIEKIPEQYLLWFHHVPWDYKMDSGRTLWEELTLRYQQGVDEVRAMRKTWNGLAGKIDGERFERVSSLLDIQLKHARFWKDACILYFQTFSGMPIPDGVEKPDKPLEYYMAHEFKYLPGS